MFISLCLLQEPCMYLTRGLGDHCWADSRLSTAKRPTARMFHHQNMLRAPDKSLYGKSTWRSPGKFNFNRHYTSILHFYVHVTKYYTKNTALRTYIYIIHTNMHTAYSYNQVQTRYVQRWTLFQSRPDEFMRDNGYMTPDVSLSQVLLHNTTHCRK